MWAKLMRSTCASGKFLLSITPSVAVIPFIFVGIMPSNETTNILKVFW